MLAEVLQHSAEVGQEEQRCVMVLECRPCANLCTQTWWQEAKRGKKSLCGKGTRMTLRLSWTLEHLYCNRQRPSAFHPVQTRSISDSDLQSELQRALAIISAVLGIKAVCCIGVSLHVCLVGIAMQLNGACASAHSHTPRPITPAASTVTARVTLSFESQSTAWA